ncbi:MAG: RNA polymerase sigma factor [Chitinophagales bacterium]
MPHPNELIKLTGLGDKSAFHQLFGLFKDRVYNLSLSYLQDKHEAEETTQDVFVEIYQSAIRFEGNSSASTWIYRIAINKSLDKLRYRKRKKRFAYITSIFHTNSGELKHKSPQFEHPGALLENKENSKILFVAIQKLPEQQKTAFLLSYIEDIPRKEVAEIMATSLKSVESLLQRAKANLRTDLRDFYEQTKD